MPKSQSAPPTAPILPVLVAGAGHVAQLDARSSISFKFLWWSFSALMMALTAAFVLINANEYEHIKQRERARLLSSLKVVDENLSQQLSAADAALNNIRADLPFMQRQSNGLDLLSRRMLAFSQSMPGVRTFMLLDTAGLAVASNRRELLGRDFSDRSYFRDAIEKRDRQTLHVSEPFRTALGVYALNLSKVLMDESGRISGVITATIDPDFFTALMSSVRYADDMWVALAHGNGLLMLVSPARPDLVGADLARPGSLFMRHRESGESISILEDRVYTTGEFRLMAQQTIRSPELKMSAPLVLAITRDMPKVHAEWRRDATTNLAFLIALGFIGTAALAFHHKRERALGRLRAQQLQKQLASETSLRIAATAFESQEGILIADASNQILRVNRAFTQMTGYSPEEAIGQTPRLLQSKRHGKDFYQNMWSVITATGTWSGEIWNRRKNGEVYPAWLTISGVRDETGKATHYVANLVDITERKAAEEEIQSLAFFDPLTKLPNRRMLIDRLQHAQTLSLRTGELGALLFVDLDNFKTLNDTRGHMRGDALLEQVAQRLVAAVREYDTVARLGGDEFLIMAESLKGDPDEAARQAGTIAEKLMVALSRSYDLGDFVYHCTPSIGITLFGLEAESVEEPLKRADLAMYQAKAAGRNSLRFFDVATQTMLNRRAELETALREAIAQQQFSLYYQAQVANGGKIIGAEVLLRWPRATGAMVSPADFIPLAEETGLIVPLGHWVIDMACGQLAQWATHEERSRLTLSVNVSPRQFHQDGFVQDVTGALKRHGVNPKRLKLELTESILVNNVQAVASKMAALQALGVGFSLDDFGTGYSSLAYLKRLPLDQLKIDQGFVRDILADANDAAIARMIIALGESMGLMVIAEGVETDAQRERLASEGCHAYQGYLFCRPMPIGQFEDYLEQIYRLSAPAAS